MSKLIKIGSVLKQVKRAVVLDDEKEYILLGVKWYGHGMFLRETKKGREIKADKLYQVKEGDFVYNRLFAWKSSFAIVREEHDNCLVSNEFPTFEYDENKIDPLYLLDYVLQPKFIDFVNRSSGGMSGISRKRFKEDDFINASINYLDISEQRRISQRLSLNKETLGSLSSETDLQSSLLRNLRQSILQEAIEGKLTGTWRKKNPVRKGDPEYDAAALLENIKIEKQKMIAKGKIRKDKPLAQIKSEEVPFVLPAGWVCIRLGDILRISSGDGLIAKDMSKIGTIPVFGGNGINGYHDKSNVNKPTIVIGRVGALCGSIHLTPSQAWVTDNAFITSYNEKYLDRDWLINLLKSLDLRVRARETAQPVISGQRVYPVLIPLPPLAEQRGIVERVDRLLSMVDELEKQVIARKGQAEDLLQAVLREAFESK